MKKSLFILIFVFNLIFVNFSFAQVTNVQKIWYMTNDERSKKSFLKNYKKIDILAPQVYELQLNGSVKGNMDQNILSTALENKVKVMPLLANTNGKIFNQKTILDLLTKTENWEKVSKYLREEAYNKNYYGWQLDLENIPVTQMDNLNSFVKYLKSEFGKDNLKLSIAVVAKTSDKNSDYEKWYWQNWAGVFDYKTLGENTDFVSIMAYDEQNSGGPVATLPWSKKVMDYSLQNIPSEKISFGIPTYGAAYRGKETKRFTMASYPFTYSILTNFNKRDGGNMTTGAGVSKIFGNISWVSYNKFGKNYTIWYEDKNSFQTKLKQIQDNNINSISMWVLGDEDPKVWTLFK